MMNNPSICGKWSGCLSMGYAMVNPCLSSHYSRKAILDLLLGERSIVGGQLGSVDETRQMLAFTARHGVQPMVETFPMREANAAIDHTRRGLARYRAVLVA